MNPEAVEKEIAASQERGWFAGNAEFTQDLGGVALTFELGARRFALLVAGPTIRVGDRLEVLATTLRQHLQSCLSRQADLV